MFLCKYLSVEDGKAEEFGPLTRQTRQQVQYKEISADIFSGAPRFADVPWLYSGTDNAHPIQPAIISAVTNHTTMRQHKGNKPIQKTGMLQPEEQQQIIFATQEYTKEMQ